MFISSLLSCFFSCCLFFFFFFFFNDTATTEIYTLSLHDALPICSEIRQHRLRPARHPAGPILVTKHPISERQALLLHNLGARPRVQLHDSHAGRADLITNSAARTVINRLVGRRLAFLAEALRLWTNILRPREQIGHRADWARRGADITLDAVIE